MNKLQVGNYVFSATDILGRGATGTVYLGQDIRNKTKVAIKVIKLKNINNEVTKYLLKNQVKALQIMNHPNVLRAYDVITDDNCYYVVTNYCSNKTLQDYIKEKGKIPQMEAVKIFAQIVQGYASIRKNNILHRDLKPSNILFSESNKPVICDFGYCQIAGYLPKPKMYYNVGSPAYMAPQSITKNTSSQESEIWSLGTIFYEMLQGKSFTQGKDTMQAIMQIKKVGPYIPDGVSDLTKRIVIKCMQLNPNDRIKLNDLLSIFRGGQSKPTRPNVADYRLSMTQSVQYIEDKGQHNMLVSQVNHITIEDQKPKKELTPQKRRQPSIFINQNQSFINPDHQSGNIINLKDPKQNSIIPNDIKKPSIIVRPNSNYQEDDNKSMKSMISKPDVFPEYIEPTSEFDQSKIPPPSNFSKQQSYATSKLSITSEMRNDFIKSNLHTLQKRMEGALQINSTPQNTPSTLNNPSNGVFTNELKVRTDQSAISSHKSLDSNKSQNQMLNSAAFLFPTAGSFAKNVAQHQNSLLKPLNPNEKFPSNVTQNLQHQKSLQKIPSPSVLVSFSKPMMSQLPKPHQIQATQQSYQSHLPLANPGYYPPSSHNYYKGMSNVIDKRY